MRSYFKRFFLIVLLLNPFVIYGDAAWDNIRFDGLVGGVAYNVNMGSGFFINDHNIVTNRHVVANCKNIAIRGAAGMAKAELVILDKDLDLALLYSPISPSKVPYLRLNYDAIKQNDILVTVGYPLKHAETGDFVIRDTEVIAVEKNPNHAFTSISFRDVIDHGNSGGPLLDKNSNIVGVVTAQIDYYKDHAETELDHSTGFAIGLDGLVDFLRRNNAQFVSNSSYDIFTNYNPEKIVKDYMMNIHCISE